MAPIPHSLLRTRQLTEAPKLGDLFSSSLFLLFKASADKAAKMFSEAQVALKSGPV